MTEEKKKIIYVVTKGNWGGAQKYVFDLATSLPRDEYDALVVHGDGDILGKKLQKRGIRTFLISEMGRDINIFREVIVVFKIFRVFLKEKPNIVHLSSSKAAGLGALIARFYQLITYSLKLKAIVTVHGWAFNEPRFNNFLIKFFSWFTVFLSTKTIVMSKQNLEQGLNMPFVKNKFVLIYNGIKEIDFRDRNSARNFIGGITKAPIQKPWLVTISELHKNKGLDYLIEAVSDMEDKPIVFVIHEGEERYNLENLIKKYNLEENIFLMGFIENASEYLRAFDLFTLTSIKEGHPYVLLEAGLAMLPVVASNISGINDIILNNENGILVQPRDSNSIREALEKLLLDKKKMAQLGANLESEVKNKFSFEEMLERTVKLY